MDDKQLDAFMAEWGKQVEVTILEWIAGVNGDASTTRFGQGDYQQQHPRDDALWPQDESGRRCCDALGPQDAQGQEGEDADAREGNEVTWRLQ